MKNQKLQKILYETGKNFKKKIRIYFFNGEDSLQ